MSRLIKNVELVGKQNQIVKITLDGYIDVNNVKKLENQIKEGIKNNKIFYILDLDNVEFVASAGWGGIVSLYKKLLNVGGDIKLINMNKNVEDVFHLLEFDKMISYFDTEKEAIKAIVKGEEVVEKKKIELENKDNIKNIDKLKDKNIDKKIENILKTYPDISISDVKKMLKQPQYGNINISIFKLFFKVNKIKSKIKDNK